MDRSAEIRGLQGSIALLYGDEAGLYALLAEDRDFTAQARFLAAVGFEKAAGGRFLELFAGPARHAQELVRHHGIASTAVDSSSEMKALAMAAGAYAPDRYVVARHPPLPPIGELGGPFGAASILRYSVGYLEPVELLALLRGLRSVLLTHGRLVVEVHDLALVRSDFRALGIRERIMRSDDGTAIRCVWPKGELRWRADDWVVEMDVLIQRLNGDRVVAEYELCSVERIYARSEIVALAAASGFVEVPLTSSAEGFVDGSIVLLEAV